VIHRKDDIRRLTSGDVRVYRSFQFGNIIWNKYYYRAGVQDERMPGPLHPAVSVGFLSATAGLCVAGIAWRQRDPHGARVYAILMVVLSVWSSSYALQLLHPTVSEKGPLFLLRHSISPAIGVLF
jgi:hypothetical protein